LSKYYLLSIHSISLLTKQHNLHSSIDSITLTKLKNQFMIPTHFNSILLLFYYNSANVTKCTLKSRGIPSEYGFLERAQFWYWSWRFFFPILLHTLMELSFGSLPHLSTWFYLLICAMRSFIAYRLRLFINLHRHFQALGCGMNLLLWFILPTMRLRIQYPVKYGQWTSTVKVLKGSWSWSKVFTVEHLVGMKGPLAFRNNDFLIENHVKITSSHRHLAKERIVVEIEVYALLFQFV